MQGSRATRLGSRESQASVRYPHGSSCTLSGHPVGAPTGPEQHLTPSCYIESGMRTHEACPASLPASLGFPCWSPNALAGSSHLHASSGKAALAARDSPSALLHLPVSTPPTLGCFACCNKPGVDQASTEQAANNCCYRPD